MNNIESWMVSAVIGIITYVSVVVTNKNKIAQHDKDIEKLQTLQENHKKDDEKLHSKMFCRIDELNTEIAEHKIRLSSAPSMEQVDAKFVSKEMFNQMQKHIDEKFDTMGKSMYEMLGRVLDNQKELSNKLEKVGKN